MVLPFLGEAQKSQKKPQSGTPWPDFSFLQIRVSGRTEDPSGFQMPDPWWTFWDDLQQYRLKPLLLTNLWLVWMILHTGMIDVNVHGAWCTHDRESGSWWWPHYDDHDLMMTLIRVILTHPHSKLVSSENP